MVQKQVKRAMKKNKKKHTEELRAFEKMSVSDSDQESINSSSCREGENSKLGSGELFSFNNNATSVRCTDAMDFIHPTDIPSNKKYMFVIIAF